LIHTSEFALSVVKTFGDRMADGSMPKPEAKKRALLVIFY
jgi:methyl-accepting chemotaxis protein